MPNKVAIAIGAHPDDIEFYMAGTLLMLKKAGYETHYMTVANGNCGSLQYNAAMTRSVRNAEARAWAQKVLDKKPTMPRYLQRRERPWFRRARALLKRVPA